MAKKRLRWRKKPDQGDYAAAAAFLSLVATGDEVKGVVARLKRATTTLRKPKDLERASGVELLPADDPLVKSEIKKSRSGKPLAPVLLVRGRLEAGHPLVIADGYHRICAGFHVNQDAEIPCRVVDLP